MKNYKILITGGHVTPALALIQELQKRKKYSVFFFGRTYSFSQAKKIPSFEYETISSMNIPFIESNAPRFPSGITISSLLYPFYFLSSLIYSFKTIHSAKPDCIMSFGGYVSAPVVVAAWLIKIPIIVHEQTVVLGKANRLLSSFADTICLSWKDSKKYFSKNQQKKCVITGNPVRSEIRSLIRSKKKDNKRPVLYITGGSSGAHRINAVVKSALKKLLSTYTIYHQSGDSHYHDYDDLKAFREKLPDRLRKHYFLYRYTSGKQLNDILDKTDIIVGRSGANTIIEQSLLGVPSILVPLPESAFDEQQKQAELLEKNQVSRVIRQEELTAERLVSEIESMNKSLQSYTKHAKHFSQTQTINLHKMAHTRLADCIDTIIYRSVNSISSQK